MKKDTQTFLITMLTIPAFLSVAWAIHAQIENTTVPAEDSISVVDESPVAFAEEEPVETLPAPVIVPVKKTTAPAAVPKTVVKPVVAPVVVVQPKPAVIPKKVVVRHVRKTSAS